jgi:hypothetical protein
MSEKYAPKLTAEQLTQKMIEGFNAEAKEAKAAPKKYDAKGGQYIEVIAAELDDK